MTIMGFFDAYMYDFVIIFRMVFALAIGFVIGRERQRAQKSAGMRTHMIVCVSSAAVVAVSLAGFASPDSGARTLSSVITGIGFLGAGQIMTTGGKVSGITTAASIWASALLGGIVGMGYYVAGAFGTVLLYFTFRLKK